MPAYLAQVKRRLIGGELQHERIVRVKRCRAGIRPTAMMLQYGATVVESFEQSRRRKVERGDGLVDQHSIDGLWRLRVRKRACDASQMLLRQVSAFEQC